MTSASSSSAQAGRRRLADQLREIRLDAKLSGRALASAAGWHGGSKISKIEHAARPPSAEDIRDWCRVCGVTEDRRLLRAELGARVRALLRADRRRGRGHRERAPAVRGAGQASVPGLQRRPIAAQGLRRLSGGPVGHLLGRGADPLARGHPARTSGGGDRIREDRPFHRGDAARQARRCTVYDSEPVRRTQALSQGFARCPRSPTRCRVPG